MLAILLADWSLAIFALLTVAETERVPMAAISPVSPVAAGARLSCSGAPAGGGFIEDPSVEEVGGVGFDLVDFVLPMGLLFCLLERSLKKKQCF